jgi:hypothetical protein
MGRHTRGEFAQLCGLSSGNLSNYIKRGKVIVDGEYIDDNVFENREFLSKRQGFKEKNPGTSKPQKPKKVKSTTHDAEDSGDIFQDLDNFSPDDSDDSEDILSGSESLNNKRMKVDIKKKTEEAEILKLKKERIKGEIVPVDLMKNLFSMHTQSIVTAQKDGIEELLISLSVEARLSGEQLARLRRKMVDILNNSVDKAIIITQKNMQAVVGEFSIKREVGEHD